MDGKLYECLGRIRRSGIIEKGSWRKYLPSLFKFPNKKALKNSSLLTFLGLEIPIHEQAVCHNNHTVPLTHHEFFTLLYLSEKVG